MMQSTAIRIAELIPAVPPVPVAEVVAAMQNFEEAASNARKCLEDLTIHQQCHGAFQPSTLMRLMDEN